MINHNSRNSDLIYSVLGVVKMNKLKTQNLRKVLIIISVGIFLSACGNTLSNENDLTS